MSCSLWIEIILTANLRFNISVRTIFFFILLYDIFYVTSLRYDCYMQEDMDNVKFGRTLWHVTAWQSVSLKGIAWNSGQVDVESSWSGFWIDRVMKRFVFKFKFFRLTDDWSRWFFYRRSASRQFCSRISCCRNCPQISSSSFSFLSDIVKSVYKFNVELICT